MVESCPASSARLRSVSWSEPAISFSSWPTITWRSAASRSAASGLKQTTNRSSSGDVHLFNLQVVHDDPVTALACQRRGRLGGAGAQPFTEDVAVPAGAQFTPVGRGGEPAIPDPDDAGQGPFPQVGLGLADQGGVGGVARPGPHPDRDAGARDGHAD